MGSKYAAQSPAIDQGSEDAWGYDSTSTNPKVIDMGQPDIGYHYYRRVADDDNAETETQEITISFRQPQRSFDDDQLKAYGYRLFKQGGTQVEEFGYAPSSDALAPTMEDTYELRLQDRYDLELKTYFWVDKDGDGIEDHLPEDPVNNEVYYSDPASIGFIVDWEKPNISTSGS